jgi:heptosyltransferase-3
VGRLAPCLVSVDPVPAGLVTSREQLRFLVFRGGALGDVLFTLPVLRTLRQSDPSASVEFVAPFPAALLAAYGGAHSVSDLGSAAFVSLFTEDAGLDAALSEKLGHTDCVISYLSDPRGTVNAKIRNCGCQFIPGPFRLSQRQVPAPVQLAQPLSELGLEVNDTVPRLFLERQRSPRTRLIFHVGSGATAKNWPASRWCALAVKLEEWFDELLLVSGEADEAPTSEFLRRYRSSKLQIRSNLSVLDLAKELATGDLFVGHDTGVTHLAAALAVPTVALFGPTDPLIWRPLGENVTLVVSSDGMMDSIMVEQVWAAVRRCLIVLSIGSSDPRRMGAIQSGR